MSKNRVRFTKDKYRFVITENGVNVYRREYSWFGDTEYAVTPQIAGKMRKKYASDIKAASKHLNG